MRNHQQQQQKQPFQDARNSFNILFFLTWAHALCIWPFIRCRFGVNAFGAAAAAGFVMILAYAGSARSEVMVNYFWPWLVLVALHRMAALRRERRGDFSIHSRYPGYPWLAMKLPFVKDEITAKRLEPFICFFAGALLVGVDKGLGGFLLIGAFTTAFTTGIGMEQNRVRLRRMNDAMTESAYVAGQFDNRG